MASTNRLDRIFSYLIPVGVAAYFCALVLRPITDFDVWSHIKIGEWIVQNRSIPHHNLFMWPAWEYGWVDHEWLSQVFFYGVHRLLGMGGLFLGVIVIFGLAFLILWRLWMRLNGRLYLGAICFLVAITACRTRLIPRPEIFTFLGVALLLHLLYRYKYDARMSLRGAPATKQSHEKDMRLLPPLTRGRNDGTGKSWIPAQSLWLIPPIFVLWVNLHGGVFIGLLVLALFIVSEALSAIGRSLLGFRAKQQPSQQAQQTSQAWSAWLPLALTGLAACLINPYGLGYFSELLQTRESAFAQTAGIVEWRPLFDTVNPCPERAMSFYLVMAIVIPALLLRLKRLSFTNLVLVGTLAFMTISARRYLGLLGVVSIPVWATALADLQLPEGWREKIARWWPPARWFDFAHHKWPAQALGLTIVLAVAATTAASAYRQYHRSQGWVYRDLLPVGASNFLERIPIRDRMFNAYMFGGYLCWRLYPEREVFIQGIMGAFDERLFDPYLQVVRGSRDAATSFDAWKINYVILPQPHANVILPDHLYRYLNGSPDWTLVYWDGVAVIYLRASPSNAELLRRYAYQAINPAATNRIVTSASPESVAREIRRALQADPPTVPLYLIAGDLWYALGQWEEALATYGKALYLLGHNAEIEMKIGLCLQQKGELAQALPYFESAVRLMPRWAEARVRLAGAYQAQGNAQGAIRQLETAHKLHPENAEILNLLGAAYYLAGKSQQAADSFQRVIELRPDFAEAYVNLGNGYLQMGKLSEASAAFGKALQLQPGLGSALYGMACAQSRAGTLDSSLDYLQQAIASDPKWRKAALADPDLAALRNHPGFAQVLEK